MLTLRLFVALLGSVRIATAKAVFAHFMVSLQRIDGIFSDFDRGAKLTHFL